MNGNVADIKKQVKLKYKVLSLKLNRNEAIIKMIAYFDNSAGLEIGRTRLYIDGDTFLDIKLAECKGTLSRSSRLKQVHVFRFKIRDILDDESRINSIVRITAEIEGQEVSYAIKEDRKYRNNKFNYLPVESVYVDDFALHFRHSFIGTLKLVKRRMEDIESTFFFRFMESAPVSALLYGIGRLRVKLRKKKLNIYYEKFCSKADEGTFELFKLSQQSVRSVNYFLIDETSDDFERLMKEKNVVRRFSFRYYWLVYGADTFISTEVPESHVTVLRSNNYYLRKAIYETDLVFLQHGIVYMKHLGAASSFQKGRSGESRYMVVSSEKERDVCVEMLGYDREHFFVTGIPVFSRIDYRHINQDSDDYIMVMLTWKPYEEQLYDFSKSEYYRNVIEITEMLEKYFPKDRIIVLGHPKVDRLLESVDIRLWDGPVSEALNKAKVLITDYSSVCYNSFYHGAGVVFYQPDLARYEEEVGSLIPKEDEYIGERAFNINELEKIIGSSVKDGVIDLGKLRTEKHEEIYATINEFHDGRNVERIIKELSERQIV